MPSGLTLYWFTNNVLSTAQQLYLKATVKVDIPEASAAVAGAGSVGSRSPVVKPKEERIKAVTGKDLNARKKKKRENGEEIEEVEAEVMMPSGNGASSSSAGASDASGKGDKFRALRAREAAAKAKEAASVGAGAGSSQEPPASGSA